eukprot:GFYU01011184.1.p1 GENE.GFYU01011184.1~~GFYU01011184.1.p1  ORF type:complete len:379 (-),score=128.65 GFYU01011184.1:105-1241(-)
MSLTIKLVATVVALGAVALWSDHLEQQATNPDVHTVQEADCSTCKHQFLTFPKVDAPECKLAVYDIGASVPLEYVDLPDCTPLLTHQVAKLINSVAGTLANAKYTTSTGQIIPNGGVIPNNEVWAHNWNQYFVWPTFEPGHVATKFIGAYSTPSYAIGSREVTLTTLIDSPRVFQIDNFMTPEECDHIISLGKPKMQLSGTATNGKTTGSEKHYSRNSDTAWVDPRSETDMVKTVRHRVETITTVPMALAESLQVLHYDPGEYYHAHHDFFSRKMYPDREDLRTGRNRFITLLLYLNDVEEGGETNFPYGFDKSAVMDNADCTRGFKAAPKKGSAIMFYNLDAKYHMDGVGDVNSLHAACEVRAGEKWAANYWIYNKG